MLFKLSTDKTVSEAAAVLQTAVQANRFGAGMPVLPKPEPSECFWE